EIAQYLIATMKHGDLDTEPGKDRCELHADIAGADDDDGLGQPLELKALIGADEMLRARQHGDHRMAPGGNQDRLGAHRRIALGELHRVPVFERGAVEDNVYAGLLQGPRIDAVQPIHLAPDIADQGRPVEAQTLAGPAETARFRKGAPIAATID